jgi:uncharacterized glyoxalase superfamily protein PhnB
MKKILFLCIALSVIAIPAGHGGENQNEYGPEKQIVRDGTAFKADMPHSDKTAKFPVPKKKETAVKALRGNGVYIMKTMIIFYVSDQRKSRDFYAHVLGNEPILDVPGMTEFPLGENFSLGLMPEKGIKNLLGEKFPDPAKANGIPRAELYLIIDNPSLCHERALKAGAIEIKSLGQMPWGDLAAYSLDPDGHALAFAKSSN